MKKAVVLFNLGGPDSLENVQPFLFNLFNDKAIIALPNPFRRLLAGFISKKRNEKAQGIYSKIGGKSPIVELTNKQAAALQAELGSDYKVFVCMRYWHPMSAEVAAKVREYAPDEIILLPLYPQFSTTTTGSSITDFAKHKFNAPIKTIGCYPLNEDFLQAHIDLLKPAIEQHPDARVLFSAHGLPEKVIAKGDPYQKHVEQSSGEIAKRLGLKDWKICYQSKVGPLPWLKPNSADEIEQAGKDGKDIILVPISFVSEHSETLVELDMDFRDLAAESNVKHYIRIPALGTHPSYIKCLAELCREENLPCSCLAGTK